MVTVFLLFKDKSFLQKAFSTHVKNKHDVTLITRDQIDAGTNYRAIWTNEDQRVLDIAKKEKTDQLPKQFIGVMILSSEIVHKIPFGPSHIFDDYLIPQLKELNVRAINNNELIFFETGNEKDFLAAQEKCLNKIPPQDEGSYWQTLYEITKYYNIDLKNASVLRKQNTYVIYCHYKSVITLKYFKDMR